MGAFARVGPVLALLACAWAGLPWAARAATTAPVPGPATVLDGPSPDILGLSGMSIARDGTGAVVYLKDVSDVAHVFVSRLVAGAFQPPSRSTPAWPERPRSR